MKYEELIDKYLLGKMTPVEEQAFLTECKANKELKEEAVMMAYLVKHIRSNPMP